MDLYSIGFKHLKFLWNIVAKVVSHKITGENFCTHMHQLLFIFDKATGLTTKDLALIFFETFEKFSSPGIRVVFNPKIFPTL